MLDPALRRLIWLLAKAAVRNLVAKAKTPQGAALTVCLVLFIGMTFGPTIAFRLIGGGKPPFDLFRLLAPHAPFLLFTAAVLIVVLDLGRGLLDLRPPELQFVLAGPFTNSQMLTYRLCSLCVNFVWVTLVIFVVFVPSTNHPIAALFGLGLSGVFILLLGLIRTLLTPVLSSHVVDFLRVTGLLALSTVMIEFSMQWSSVSEDSAQAMFQNALDRCVLMPLVSYPFRAFGFLMLDTNWSAMIGNLLIASGMCLGALWCCYRVNSGFAELAVEGVARKKQKMQRMQQGQFTANDSTEKARALRLPMFPWMGGVGVVAWSQWLITFRRFGKLALGLMVISLIVTPVFVLALQSMPTLLSASQRAFILPTAMAVASYLGFILLVSGQLGFACHSRQLFWYQQLPFHGFSVGAGMQFGMFSLLVLVRISFFAVAVVATSMTMTGSVALLVGCVAFDLAFVTALNLVTGCTRFSPAVSGTPDIFHVVRGMMFVLVLGAVLAGIALTATLVALPLALLTGPSWTSAGWSAAFGLSVLLPPLWWLTGQTFATRELEISE